LPLHIHRTLCLHDSGKRAIFVTSHFSFLLKWKESGKEVIYTKSGSTDLLGEESADEVNAPDKYYMAWRRDKTDLHSNDAQKNKRTFINRRSDKIRSLLCKTF